MAKLTLDDLSSLTNETTAVATLNANNALIETALENTLSRDGTSPNSMSAQLDMNSNKIINLSTPTANTDAATKAYVDSVVGGGVTGADGADGDDGSSPDIFVQASAPATTGLAGSLWIDSDSVDLDLYRLAAGAWVDTTVNLKATTVGTGDVTGPSASSDGEVVVFNSTTGKVVKRSNTLSGLAKLTSGVLSAASAGTDYVAPSGALGTPSSGTLTNCTGLPQAGVTGLTTSSSPQFAELNLGNASDTTFTRVSAGVAAIEGNNIVTANRTASTSQTGIVELATDAETRAGTSTSLAVTPANLTGARIYGYLPQVSKSADYTLSMTAGGPAGTTSDESCHLLHPAADTSARTWTIPANASVAFPIGTTITFINQNGAGTISIAITSDTLRLAGSAATAPHTLAANGIATAVKITSTEWIISGVGLT